MFKYHYYFNILKARKGKVHFILKKVSKPRKSKAELLRYRQEKQEEERHIRFLLDTEARLGGKRNQADENVNVLNDKNYSNIIIGEKSSMVEDGSVKSVQL